MSIFIRCPACKSEQSIRKKKREPRKCKNEKCAESLPRKDKKYRIVVKFQKKIERLMVTGSLETARKIEEKIRTELIEGTYYDRRKKREVPTLNKVWDNYFSWAKEMTRGWKTGLSRYKCSIRDRLGNKKLNMISPMDITKMTGELKKEGKKKKGIIDIAELITRLYNHAKRHGLYEGDNPVKKASLPKVRQGEPVYLKSHELKSLWLTCGIYPDKQIGNMVKFILLSGRRSGEAFKLLWDDVDFSIELYTIRESKSGKDETYPLTGKTLEVLKDQAKYKVEGSPYVFPGRRGCQRSDIKGPWIKLKKMAGLPEDFKLHGLRHDYGFSLINKGINERYLQHLFGHSSTRMTQRYSHVSDSTIRQAAQMRDQVIDEVLLGEDDKNGPENSPS